MTEQEFDREIGKTEQQIRVFLLICLIFMNIFVVTRPFNQAAYRWYFGKHTEEELYEVAEAEPVKVEINYYYHPYNVPVSGDTVRMVTTSDTVWGRW